MAAISTTRARGMDLGRTGSGFRHARGSRIASKLCGMWHPVLVKQYVVNRCVAIVFGDSYS
jgi:hypothetical protein